MLITVPATIWSTRYRIASTARSHATRPPTRAPASTPIHRLSATLATIEDANAADSSIPSIAMFTTPDRSQSTPESAPKVIGTDRSRLLCSIPRRLSERPCAPHTRNAKTKMNTTTPSTRFIRRPNPRVSWMPPRNMHTTASTSAVTAEGTTTSGRRISGSCPDGFNPRRDVTPAAVGRPNASRITRPTTT